MTWFKVDDSFHSHPKVLAAEPAALGLWVVAGAWCSANLTDGFVPDYAVPRLLPDAARLAEKLVACRLWKRTKGGYRFHDWREYNPTASEVNSEREAARERMRILRRNRRTNPEPPGQPDDCSGEQQANVQENFGARSQPRPDPTRSTTSQPPYGTQGRNARPREEPPPSSEPPSRTEQLLAEYRANSPRGIPSRQAERLAAEIHQLAADGYTDPEIRAGLAQLRTRRLGPATLPSLVDELANTTPSNVVALRGHHQQPRASTTDQRVAAGLELAAYYDSLDPGGQP